MNTQIELIGHIADDRQKWIRQEGDPDLDPAIVWKRNVGTSIVLTLVVAITINNSKPNYKQGQ